MDILWMINGLVTIGLCLAALIVVAQWARVRSKVFLVLSLIMSVAVTGLWLIINAVQSITEQFDSKIYSLAGVVGMILSILSSVFILIFAISMKSELTGPLLYGREAYGSQEPPDPRYPLESQETGNHEV
jgi:hypothetical protein